MKVILLAPTPPPVGGMATWTVRMMNAKLKHNWQIKIVDEKILGQREMFGDKIRHDWLAEIKRCLHIWGRVIVSLKDKDATIVHSSIAANTMPVLREYVCALITKLHRRKFIIHFHCTVPNIVHGKINQLVVRMLCNISDCVIVLNKQSAQYVKSISRTRVKIIPNFLDAEEIEDCHIINDDVKKILYVGGVIESKGCLDLIDVAKSFPDIEFRFVGNPNSTVKRAASQVRNVTLLGVQNHDQVHVEMMQCDVFAFLSYFSGEGFSISLTEAMGCGMPCLVSDWAANKDMINDKGGRVVSPKNSKEAIEALNSMLNANIRREQSQRNIRKVRTEYAADVVLNQYVECYESCLKRRKFK